VDYFGILKKAWEITWRYKVLWVLGLFAGSTSGLSSSTRDVFRQQYDQGSQQGADWFGNWVGQSPAIFIAIAGVLGVVALVLWVVSVAAQGGLVRGVDDAASGRTPVLRDAWSAGFAKWGRVFMLSFVLGIPVAVVIAIMVAAFVALGIGGAAGGDQAAGAAIVGGLCFVLPLFVIIIVALSLALGIVFQLALRYAVLQDVTFGQAIKRGWNDLWAKRGAVVFWLVMLLPGIAYSVIVGIVSLPLAVPMAVMLVQEKLVMAAGLGILLGLLMLFPTAVYGTFVSSAWTVFFRRMTGMEPVAEAAPAYVPPAPAAYAPPAPPVAPPPAMPAEAPVVDVAVPAAPEAGAGFTPPAPEVPPAGEVPPTDA